MPGSQHAGIFTRFAQRAAFWSGHPAAFIGAASVIVIWALCGPIFGFSDTWQLVINTGTTIITFLMVFLIQNSQNRDTAAIQIKLDELIRANRGAHNVMLNLEELTSKELEEIRGAYIELAEQAREKLRDRREEGQNDIVELLRRTDKSENGRHESAMQTSGRE